MTILSFMIILQNSQELNSDLMKISNKISYTIFGLILILILIAMPTGYEDALIYKDSPRAVAKVLDTDNSMIISTGLIQSGEQECQLKICTGGRKNQIVQGVNFLSGSLENDKIFKVGDYVYIRMSIQDNEVTYCVISDYFRLGTEIVLIACFIFALILIAGWKGFHAILSFMITVLSIWKLLIPSYLKGYSPMIVGLLVTTFITLVIIFFVYGIDIRTLIASAGSMLGILLTCFMGAFFTDIFKIHGAIMPNSEALLYSGYQTLNLTSIFMSSIFIGASGAMMDISVDITSAVYEICEKNPSISSFEAVKSGFRVGRAAMGTMTTTLLLAYTGSNITSIMVYMAQGTPIDHILNYKYMAAEIIDTIIGSFGLVMVAPFTAVVAGIMLTGHHRNRVNIVKNVFGRQ